MTVTLTIVIKGQALGNGIKVYKNNILQKDVTLQQTFTFNAGDTFTVSSHAGSGMKFEGYCGNMPTGTQGQYQWECMQETPCTVDIQGVTNCITQSVSPEMSGSITVGAYFGMKSSPCSSFGDIFLDGYIGPLDIDAINMYVAGTIDLTADQLYRADVNGDGIVDLTDASLISQYITGKISTFPACSLVHLTSITISPSSMSVEVGMSQQLTAACTDASGNVTCPTLLWTSDTDSIATVDSSGKVTGILQGTANIAAKYGNITSNSVPITVITPALTLITVYPSVPTIAIGYIQQFSAVCIDQIQNIIDCPLLTWSVSNPDQGSITSTGLFTAIGSSGTVTVSARSGDITGSATVTLTSEVGYIFISSNPLGAEIFIDSVDQNITTPMMITSSGVHNYELRLNNFKKETGTFDASLSPIVIIYKTLTKLSTGCQSFASSPTKAEIFIDDKDTTFKTPKPICNLPLGNHTFRLDGIFTIPGPKSSCVLFDSIPKGAKIFIDRTDTGKATPYKICNIIPGNHMFSLRGTITITK